MKQKGYQVQIKPNTKNHFNPSEKEFGFKYPNNNILKLESKQKIGTEIIELPTETRELTRYEWKFKTKKCSECPYQEKCTINKDYRQIKFKLTEVEMEHMMKIG
jgi:hypothetical protein